MEVQSKGPREELASAISSLVTAVETSRSADLEDISLASARLVDTAKTLSDSTEAEDLLVETMLCHQTPEVRQASGLALAGKPSERVEKAFRLECILRQFANCHYLPYGEVGNEPEDPKALAEELKTMIYDPAFVDRMIAHVLSSRSFAYEVALAVRETPLSDKQADIRRRIEEKIGDQWEFASRDEMQYLPLALDASVPRNRDLLFRILSEGSNSFRGNFERAAILTLSESQTPEAVRFLERKFFSNEAYPPAQSASVAEGLGMNMNEEYQNRLVEIAASNRWKAAWTIAGFGKTSGAKRVWEGFRLLCNPIAIEKKRLEAALALSDCCPDLARNVLTRVSSGRSEAERRCRSDFGFYIQRGLARLSKGTEIG